MVKPARPPVKNERLALAWFHLEVVSGILQIALLVIFLLLFQRWVWLGPADTFQGQSSGLR